MEADENIAEDKDREEELCRDEARVDRRVVPLDNIASSNGRPATEEALLLVDLLALLLIAAEALPLLLVDLELRLVLTGASSTTISSSSDDSESEGSAFFTEMKCKHPAVRSCKMYQPGICR